MTAEELKATRIMVNAMGNKRLIALCDTVDRLQKALERLADYADFEPVSLTDHGSVDLGNQLWRRIEYANQVLNPTAQVPAPDASETTTDSPVDPGAVGS